MKGKCHCLQSIPRDQHLAGLDLTNQLASLIASTMSTSRARKSPVAARLERENAQDEVYERIYTAIVEHRLHPGTKLVEERLAEIFGTSRARIREVLARMAHEQIVELIPQRGAYVARPTIEQAMHVFEARRLIAPAVLRRRQLDLASALWIAGRTRG